MIRIIRERVQPIIAYHGTSDAFLREILKKGMLPDPAKRTWQDDEQASVTTTSRVSLPGSYWTRNLNTAMSSAGNTTRKFGGSQIYVIASLVPESGVVDEDDIVFTFRRGVGVVIKDRFRTTDASSPRALIPLLLLPNSDLDSIVDEIGLNLHQQWASGREGKTSKRPYKPELFYSSIKTYLKRQLVYSLQEMREMDINSYLRDYDIDPYSFDIEKEIGNPVELDNKFLSEIDSLTRYYRELALGIRAGEHYNNVRMLEPVTYSGRNRIVCIVRELDTSKFEIVYGNLPRESEKDFQKTIGGTITFV